jgi:hypothetical protein
MSSRDAEKSYAQDDADERFRPRISWLTRRGMRPITVTVVISGAAGTAAAGADGVAVCALTGAQAAATKAATSTREYGLADMRLCIALLDLFRILLPLIGDPLG